MVREEAAARVCNLPGLARRLLIIIAIWPAVGVGAPKTDILVFRNGDHLTGEVKGLDRGRLSFDTDATGTVSIEWAHVSSIESRMCCPSPVRASQRSRY